MSNATYTVELAFDAAGTDEATAEYCAWLNAQGHQATIGRSTATYIDGCSTSSDNAREIGNALWDEFCNSY